jgi:lactoylglutathione lyase
MSHPLGEIITGLFETHTSVADLDRSRRFYEDALGLELGFQAEERRVAIYWIGRRGEAFLGLWEKPPDQIISQHFALEIASTDMGRALAVVDEEVVH